MKAIELTAPGDIRVVDRREPIPKAGEVLLRVRRVGCCGTDLSSYRGINPLVSYPRVMGHEIGATIERIGPGVDGPWRAGQNVLVIPYSNCGECSACRAGRYNCCARNETLGVQREGAMTELIAAPAAKLITSDRLAAKELALVEPITIGFHAAGRGRVTADDTVAVLGCGTIGLGVVAGCAFHGARVVAIDIDDKKLALARRCGASHAINSATTDLHEKLRSLTSGQGPDVVIEAVGAPATFRLAVEEVCYAGRVVYLGYSKAHVEYDTTKFVLKEIDILGSRNALPRDFADVVRMLEAGGFPVDEVVTRSVRIDEAADAFRQWSDDPASATKIQVVMSGEGVLSMATSAPGHGRYFDLQVNGYAGVDFNSDELTAEELHEACVRLREDGVAQILATIITDDLEAMCRRLRQLAKLRGADPLAAEMIAGFHVEGPFISAESGYVGAHPVHAARPASRDEAARLLDAAEGLVRLVTLAPERDAEGGVTRWLADQGVCVSAGHCNPTLDELNRAIDAGLTMFTHLGNGCPLQMHRHDNIIQRVLGCSNRLWVCFIADGVHVPFVALKNYLAVAGPERAIVVSDAIAAAGMGPGKYTLARQQVIVDERLATWAADKSHLVGSACTMAQAVANLQDELKFSPQVIERLTIANPRAALASS